jgi:hypothetical membrane protein
MKQLPSFRSWAGLLAVVVYLLFTLLAYLRFPGPFAPAANWLSDLGDVTQNPTGAWLYNLGILLTAGLTLVFFLGFSGWKLEGQRIQNRMALLTQVFGVLGCLAMGLSAIFPIDHLALHRIFSISLYMLLGTAFVFSVAALRYLPGFPKWALGLGLAAAALDLLSSFLGDRTWMEWIVVGLFLAYLVSVSLIEIQRGSLVAAPAEGKT